ncbi:Ldh family oxidoreductase [Variovorax sp. J31P207]|uniref:Ldh family oxidoreductase n=1 Tax=Variovorax sp. J31P207 TaxID=3053510 RepID=UPI002577A8C4|nr:Ldh family oxidoreductase [Variovorax sp. J31P207]MDM0072493.1 Ldh family oxidoreductase [Variovorax sp. J31P207]
MNVPVTAEKFAAQSLKRWTTAVLTTQRMPATAAALCAGVLVRTSLRGIDTHGISRLPIYVEKLASGEVNPCAVPKFEHRAGLLHCDGDAGLGQLVGTSAVDQAMERAESSALVACSIARTGHLAALGTFVLAAAERGFFAILCQRTPPIMAMAGATGPVIGNNPIAFAIPVPGQAPLVFDMAHSVVARGHVVQALREGVDTIPGDWAIGPDGTPTTDPALALQGAMQPIAGHKGIGLAMLVECLAGSLNGALADQGPSPTSTGHGSAANVSGFLMVINPALAIGRDAFDASVSAWMQTFLNGSGPRARYPGQRQATCERERGAQGIPIPAGLLAELRSLGTRVKRPFDLHPV